MYLCLFSGVKEMKKGGIQGDGCSILLQGTPVLALTATATEEVIKYTLKGLAMKEDMHHICVSPDRPNIYLYKQKVDNDLNSTFSWLIDLLKTEANDPPRTIVYCKSQKACAPNLQLVGFTNKVVMIHCPVCLK